MGEMAKMLNDKEVLVLNSFSLTGRGIIAEMQHLERGLPAGIELHSPKSGRRWRIKNRMLFNHTYPDHQLFPAEETSCSHFSFRSLQAMMQSKASILEKESQQIFWYAIEPVNHAEKPAEGEILILIKP